MSSGGGSGLGSILDPLKLTGGSDGLSSDQSSALLDPLDFEGRAGKKALDAQMSAADKSDQTLRYMYNTQRQDLQPWRDAGTKALGSLQDNNFMQNWQQQDPGYQFRMDEGNKAITNAAAARGMGNSGATLKALTQYGQDYASNEYNNAYNRSFNRLSSLAGLGNSANSQGVGTAGNYGTQMSANQLGLGNAIAAQSIGQQNQKQGMVGSIMGAGAMAFSDERVKTNIEPVSESDLNEMRKHLRAFKFNYSSDEFGKGDWVGVMAQDLEKSKLGRTLVTENAQGVKQIDMKKVLSMFLATLAEG